MENFLGQILLAAFNFAPVGYYFCNGQVLAISQNTALFSLLGTTFGGDGTSTFYLPDLQGRLPMHMNSNYPMGQNGGAASVTLTTAQLPAHSHLFNVVAAAGDTAVPTSASYLAKSPSTGSGPNATTANIYSSAVAGVNLNPASIANTGFSSPVTTISPYLVLNYIIAITGVFPSRS